MRMELGTPVTRAVLWASLLSLQVPGLSGHVELQRKYKSATGTEGFKYAPERKAKQQLKHLERLRWLLQNRSPFLRRPSGRQHSPNWTIKVRNHGKSYNRKFIHVTFRCSLNARLRFDIKTHSRARKWCKNNTKNFPEPDVFLAISSYWLFFLPILRDSSSSLFAVAVFVALLVAPTFSCVFSVLSHCMLLIIFAEA